MISEERMQLGIQLSFIHLASLPSPHHRPSITAVSPWTHLQWQWWNLPVRPHLTGRQWNEFICMIQQTESAQNLYVPVLSLRVWPGLTCDCQLFWSLGLMISLSVYLANFFNLQTGSTRRKKMSSLALQTVCQYEWRALGYNVMWAEGCDKCI